MSAYQGHSSRNHSEKLFLLLRMLLPLILRNIEKMYIFHVEIFNRPYNVTFVDYTNDLKFHIIPHSSRIIIDECSGEKIN